MFEFYNPNPTRRNVGDCTVRAIAKATNQSWDKVYTALCMQGYQLGDMPSANAVWGAYLRKMGYTQELIPNTCPDCYTVADFANEHPVGSFILALSGHVVAVVDGVVYDSWDSTTKIPLYYWTKKE